MSDPEPIRVRLTSAQRKMLVRLLRDITEDLQFTTPNGDIEGLEEMARFGPTGVRIRDLRRMDRDDAEDILDKIDYEDSMGDYVAWLRYTVDGPYVPPKPPGAIPLGPVPS